MSTSSSTVPEAIPKFSNTAQVRDLNRRRKKEKEIFKDVSMKLLMGWNLWAF